MKKFNNPRVFAETVTLDVWRTEYCGDKAEADLHIDVGFFDGRLGGQGLSECPVRFRLSLKRAEIHIRRDHAKLVRIPASSLARAPMVMSQVKTTSTASAGISGKVKAAASTLAGFSGSAHAEMEGAAQITKKVEKQEDLGEMRITHRKLPGDDGYVFQIEPVNGMVLQGYPWSVEKPRMKIRDSKPDRKRGDPPEVTIQIRCRREDLHIHDVNITNATLLKGKFSRNKEIAVEQYLKSEILNMGFACGDLSDPFAELILGDAVSVEE